MCSQTQDKAPDGGWGWVIVAASFASHFLAYGSPQSVGVLYPEWLATFHEGKGLTAWVGSVTWGAGLIASPVCSACVVNFGARPVTVFSGVMVAGGMMLSAFAPSVQFLIFSYGTVVGLGCGLVYTATVTITCQYFDKRRGLALGIVSTGTSLGGFLYATGQNKLVELYGLEGCLLIVGAVSLNLMACAGLLRPLHPPGYYLRQREALQRAEEEEERGPARPEEPPQTTGTAAVAKDPLIAADDSPPGCGRSLLRALGRRRDAYRAYARSTGRFLRDRVFAALCVALFLFTLGAFPPVLFMEDVAQSEGLVDGVGALPLVSIVAIATAPGKLALGAMADLRWVNSAHLYAFTMAATGLALLLIPASRSYAALQVLSAVVGFFSGNWSITPYITTRLVGIDRLPEAYGVLMFFGGFGYLLGPPVMGWFYDWTQSYDVAFYFSGGCVLLGGLFLFLSALPCWERTQREKARPEIQRASNCDKMASVA
ncbi:monocarboxylate transporter 9-like isoform X2 [Anguilla anguilla]|nr:monocarboxylate transporter 9-like isoform X2 [Anguilla anguilla]XP_035255532.1 monocarboxylate transporter 9-like isoform X2 [Anguilla anguilla]XP_035255533.1 monocarboxylate transporter 9-like isoform X2 [Anguilla anguilla]XP_035255534.1 monocarboxylate transporter 9-like isoform X2 [Anguilla anguilla]